MPRESYAVFRQNRHTGQEQHWNGSAWVPHVGGETTLTLIAEPIKFLNGIFPTRHQDKFDANGWRYWFIDVYECAGPISSVPGAERPYLGG